MGDLPRTFLCEAQRMRLSEPLRRVLSAFAVLNPSVSYVQGMNFIAAFILRQFFAHPPSSNSKLIEAQCFWTFAAIMGEMDSLFVGELIGFHRTVECFSNLLNYHAPRELTRHLKALRVLSTVFSSWLHTLFTHPKLSPNSNHSKISMATRIWDILIFERMDFAIVLKMAFLVLIRHKQSLLKMDFVRVTEFCKSARCFEFEGRDDHELLLRAQKLQLNELFLAPVRNLKYVRKELELKEPKEVETESESEQAKSEAKGRSLWAYLRALLLSDDADADANAAAK